MKNYLTQPIETRMLFRWCNDVFFQPVLLVVQLVIASPLAAWAPTITRQTMSVNARRMRYYGLNSRNPAGCLKCQCSGKSENCSMDSGWVLTATATRSSVTSDKTRMDDWKLIDQGSSPIANADYYWDMCINLGLRSLTQ